MPPAKYAPGTKSASTPSEYTDAQWKALAGLKQHTPKLKYGAARAEFVNRVLLPDGTISDDLDAVRAGTKAQDAADVVRLEEFVEANKTKILVDDLTRDERAQLQDLRYWAKHSQADELEAHIAQQRFLLVVDADLVTRIYFQCVTPDNPDIDFVNPDEDPHYQRRTAARDAHEAARVARGG